MSGQTQLTAESAASSTFTMERTAQPAQSGNSEFEKLIGSTSRNPFFGWNPAPATIRNFQFRGAVLDGEFRGLFGPEGFIPGTGYLIPDEVMTRVAVAPGLLVEAKQPGANIIGCNTAYRNYFHWCSQALPAIDNSARRADQGRRITLVLPQLNAWQEESLALLGYGAANRVTIDNPAKQYALGLAEYSQILSGASAFCLSELTAQTFKRLRQAVDKLPQAGRKLYIARTDVQKRTMRNEAAVIEEVRRRGFEVIVPGTLSFTDQVQLFRSASLVVGPHGAGLTNIIFCEPGTTVYELLPAGYANGCFCNLASVCRLQYWADAFDSEGSADRPPHQRDWESDTALVTARLTEIEGILAAIQAAAERQTIGAMDFLRGKPGRLHGHTEAPETAVSEAETSQTEISRTESPQVATQQAARPSTQSSPPQPPAGGSGLLRRLWQSVFGSRQG